MVQAYLIHGAQNYHQYVDNHELKSQSLRLFEFQIYDFVEKERVLKFK